MKNEKYYIEKISSLEKEVEYLKKSLKQNSDNNHRILTRQSKMAVMGEMIGNIAHQWRQPLMELSSILITTEAKIKLTGNISNQEILEMISKSNDVMKYMSNTIDDFRDFFAKDKEKTSFKISEQVKRAANIISSALENKDIKLNIILKNNPTVYGFKNEYSQVLINIIANAKDIISNRKIKDGKIDVKIYVKDNKCITEVFDNGGGIEALPVEKVFEPFYTHGKKDGTGIGLFMSKLIVENNMEGQLKASNFEEGAKFTISIPLG